MPVRIHTDNVGEATRVRTAMHEQVALLLTHPELSIKCQSAAA